MVELFPVPVNKRDSIWIQGMESLALGGIFFYQGEDIIYGLLEAFKTDIQVDTPFQ